MNKLTDFCTRIFSGIFGNCVLEFLFLGYSTKNSSENPCMGQGCKALVPYTDFHSNF